MDPIPEVERGALSALPCPRCRSPFAALEGVSTLSFHCPRGHEVSLDGFVRSAPPSVLETLGDLSLAWEGRLRSLRLVTVRARTDGYPDLASSLEREIRCLESRQQALWVELGAGELRLWRRTARASGA
jgi:hypothetical protein